MEKKKNTILIYYEQRDYGGVDTHLAHLINHWPGQEDRLVVVSNRDNKGIEFLKRRIRRAGVEIELLDLGPRRLQARPQRGVHFLTVRLLVFLRAFGRVLLRFRPDVLLADNGGYPGALTCYLAALIGRRRYPRMRTFLLVHHAPAPGRLALRLYAWALSRLVVRDRIPLITVSRASQAALEQGTPLKPFTAIYNGIEVVPEAEERLDLRASYGIPPDLTVVGIIGPLDPHKGHAVLLQAFGQSPRLRQQARLLIVGSGSPEYVSYLRGLARAAGVADQVIFTGFLPESSTRIIREFDVLAMPSTTFEGFGYSMAEAMALGVPVVASRVGAIPEIVQDGENGLLVDPNDVQGLTRALERLVIEVGLRKRLGRRGQQHILTQFPASKMAEEYYRLLFGLEPPPVPEAGGCTS